MALSVLLLGFLLATSAYAKRELKAPANATASVGAVRRAAAPHLFVQRHPLPQECVLAFLAPAGLRTPMHPIPFPSILRTSPSPHAHAQATATATSFSTPGSATTVYFDGFAAGWRSASYGCIDCDFTDDVRVGDAGAGTGGTCTAALHGAQGGAVGKRLFH